MTDTTTETYKLGSNTPYQVNPAGLAQCSVDDQVATDSCIAAYVKLFPESKATVCRTAENCPITGKIIQPYIGKPSAEIPKAEVKPIVQQLLGWRTTSLSGEKQASMLVQISNVSSKQFDPPLLLIEKPHNPNKEDMLHGDMTDNQFKAILANEYKKLCPAENFSACMSEFEKGINVFLKDDKLESRLFDKLLTLVSITSTIKSSIPPFSPLNIVANDMVNKFHENRGGEYRSETLNEAAREHDDVKRFIATLGNEINKVFKNFSCDPYKLKIDEIKKVVFNETGDYLAGLGILIHDTEGYKVELKKLKYKNPGIYTATIKFTIYDHFGLDTPDLDMNKIHMKFFPDMFIAWFYLQHVMGFKPLLTVIENDYDIEISC